MILLDHTSKCVAKLKAQPVDEFEGLTVHEFMHQIWIR